MQNFSSACFTLLFSISISTKYLIIIIIVVVVLLLFLLLLLLFFFGGGGVRWGEGDVREWGRGGEEGGFVFDLRLV